MKTLLLLRHAKSSWDDPLQPDHERPLKRRGIKAAGRIGRLMHDRKLHPELVLCSTAVRAKETLQYVLKESGFQPVIDYSDQLYHCPPSEFAIALREVSATIRHVLMVGHNPGMEEFLLQLTGQNQTFPTAALARLEFELSDWSQFDVHTRGRLIDLWRPKDMDEK